MKNSRMINNDVSLSIIRHPFLLLNQKFMLSDNLVFIALTIALITGVFAVRLGTQLYK